MGYHEGQDEREVPGVEIPVENVYSQIAEFARHRGVRRVVLFGSRARGTNVPKSDIDIAYAGGDGARFEEDVQEHLWSLLQIDIVCLDGHVSPELLHEIERDGKVLYEAIR